MQIRDRIQELRRVRAGDLVPNPRNWRTHPPEQRDALQGILAEVGYADALLARELDDGRLELVDGHLRAEITPDALVPVLVLDVDQEEASKILLTLDPLAGLAGADEHQLSELIEQTEFENPQVRQMLDELESSVWQATSDYNLPDRGEVQIPEAFQVVVECADEQDQQNVFDRMRRAGYRCRVLTL